MNTSTIKLLTLSFERRCGSCPFRWELSVQSHGTRTILRRLNLFSVGCRMMISFSKFKNKEIKKCPLSRKISFVFWNFLILYDFIKKTVEWPCDNFEKDDDIIDFFYVENGEWHRLPQADVKKMCLHSKYFYRLMEIMVDDKNTEIDKVEAFQELSFRDMFKNIIYFYWLCPVDCGERKPTGCWLHQFYYEFKRTFENSFMSNGKRKRFRGEPLWKIWGFPPFLDIPCEPESKGKNRTQIFFNKLGPFFINFDLFVDLYAYTIENIM